MLDMYYTLPQLITQLTLRTPVIYIYKLSEKLCVDPDQLPSEKPADQNLCFSKQDKTMFSVMYYTPSQFYPINSQDSSYKHASHN